MPAERLEWRCGVQGPAILSAGLPAEGWDVKCGPGTHCVHVSPLKVVTSYVSERIFLESSERPRPSFITRRHLLGPKAEGPVMQEGSRTACFGWPLRHRKTPMGFLEAGSQQVRTGRRRWRDCAVSDHP